MELINLILHNLLAFIAIISIIVFVHEFGHFFVARLCGVKVEEFAIGFGKELFGFSDKKGTRWKICLLPMGGYVKMFGDKNPASIVDEEKIKTLSTDEKKQSFYFKNVYQRIAIVLAGPVANFILALILLAVLFKINGLNTTKPVVDEILKDSAAFEAGLLKGDEILAIDGKKITDFNELREQVAMGVSKQLTLKILRQNKNLDVTLTPKIKVSKDVFGNEIKLPMIGVSATAIENHPLGFSEAIVESGKETYHISMSTFKALYQLISGQRSIEELGGPVKIAKYSGQSMAMGFAVVIWFMAMISINLGVMNLLPLPVLDGGHFFYYVIEIILGKPLPQKVQQIGFQIGFGLIITLMLFTTFNDIRQIFIK